MNAHADESLWDVLDDTGRLLLAGVTHHAGWLATEQLRQIPGWSSGFRFVLQRAGQRRAGLLWDWRHEGPLTLLHHSLGTDDTAGVAVRSHIGGCGMALEEALRRLDQFDAAGQAELLAGLAVHFDVSTSCISDEVPN